MKHHVPSKPTKYIIREGDPTFEMSQSEKLTPILPHTTKLIQWATNGTSYYPSAKTTDQLPPGCYCIFDGPNGIFFNINPINVDDLIIIPDSKTQQIVDDIKQFWQKEQMFRSLGFLWKRGILLHGPAGSGKTSTIQLLIKQLIKLNGICIHANDPDTTIKGLKLLRSIQNQSR